MSSLFSPDYSTAASESEATRQANINSGIGSVNAAFAQYDPNFYKQRQAAYLNYALPQLASQYRGAQQNVLFGLSNKGLLGSSVAQTAQQDLDTQAATAKQSAVDTAYSQAQTLQQQIESAKSNLLSMVYAGADPSSASAQSINTAASFAYPSVYTPLANTFTDLVNQYTTNNLYNQLNALYSNYQYPYQWGTSSVPSATVSNR